MNQLPDLVGQAGSGPDSILQRLFGLASGLNPVNQMPREANQVGRCMAVGVYRTPNSVACGEMDPTKRSTTPATPSWFPAFTHRLQ